MSAFPTPIENGSFQDDFDTYAAIFADEGFETSFQHRYPVDLFASDSLYEQQDLHEYYSMIDPVYLRIADPLYRLCHQDSNCIPDLEAFDRLIHDHGHLFGQDEWWAVEELKWGLDQRGVLKKRPLDGNETHHCVPSSLGGGSDDKENLVVLAIIRHIRQHMALAILFKNWQLAYAVVVMTYTRGTGITIRQMLAEDDVPQSVINVAAKARAAAHRERSERMRGENHYFWGKHHSAATKAKISKAMRGEKNYWWGKHHSEATKAKIGAKMSLRKGEKSPFWGKHHSEATKAKVGMANRISTDDLLHQLKEAADAHRDSRGRISWAYISSHYKFGDLSEAQTTPRALLDAYRNNKLHQR